MKVLVLNLQALEAGNLLNDECLENLRRLMDMGCFGELSGGGEWNVLARQENHRLTLMEFFQQAGKLCASFDNFTSLTGRLQGEEWDYCQLTNASSSASMVLELDRELGEVLQYLDDDTILTVIGKDCFVIVSGNNPISGEYKGGSTADIAPTLLLSTHVASTTTGTHR